MRIKIKKLNDNAVLPTKATSKDFCYDVVAVSRKRVGWRTWEYGLGFAYEIDRSAQGIIKKGELDLSRYNLSIDFRPRSSVWKTGMILTNCEGTLDELYRGEVRAVFYNINLFKKNYKVGERIGQIKLGITLPLEFEFADEIDMKTDRGTGGFGSTGK